MYKRLLLFSCFAMVSLAAFAQQPRIDTTAVYILQRTSETFQSIDACVFTTAITYDVWSDELGLVKHSTNDQISIRQPNGMHISSMGDKGHRVLMYDGKKVYYYSYDKNQYAEASAPESVIQTIDAISKRYGVEFPAADFLYPTFVEDIADTGGNLIYLGMTDVGGKQCFHIAGKDANAGYQFWIADDEYFLPVKILITYYNEKGCPQYEETYSNWDINPSLPESIFEFAVPPGATKITLSPKKDS